MQQQSNEQINLTLNNVPFDTIISWLEIIWKQDNITVSTIVTTETKTMGVVNVTVRLKR
jgi:type II secretory pathway component PulM